MSDLSQIADLFLSDVRAAAAPGHSPRVPRVPPSAPRMAGQPAARPAPLAAAAPAPVVHVIFGGGRDPHVAALAATLGRRVAVLKFGPGATALALLDEALPVNEAQAEVGTPQEFADALGELLTDVEAVLIVAEGVTPLLASAAAEAGAWHVLVADGEQSMLAGYAALKALAPLERRRLSVAAVDAAAGPTVARLLAVAGRFLQWTPQQTPTLPDAAGALHAIMLTDGGAQAAALSQLAQLQAELRDAEGRASRMPVADARALGGMDRPAASACEVEAAAPQVAAPPAAVFPRLAPVEEMAEEPALPEVLDLAGRAPADVLARVLAHRSGQASLPLEVPACAGMAHRLTVGACGRLTLIVAAGMTGETLAALGRARAWLHENGGLLAALLPQFPIGRGQTPQVELYSAGTGGELLNAERVIVHAYELVRHAGRPAMLLRGAVAA